MSSWTEQALAKSILETRIPVQQTKHQRLGAAVEVPGQSARAIPDSPYGFLTSSL